MRKPALLIITIAIVAVVAVMLVRAARDDDRLGTISSTPLSTADLQFVATAAQGNDAEMELAELAQSTTSNSDIKTLAQRLEEDHKLSNRELNEIADKKDAEFPGSIGLPGMTDAQKADRDRLDALDDAAFDRAWIDHIVTKHQNTIEMFSNTTITDTDVKAYVDRTLPVLRAHLQEAKKIQAAVGK